MHKKAEGEKNVKCQCFGLRGSDSGRYKS